MALSQVITPILLVAAAVACAAGSWAFVEVALAMRSLRWLSDEARQRLAPLIEKADVTIDALNAELLRIDGIVTRFETASERVSLASETVGHIVSAPGELFSEVAGRVRRAWLERRRSGPGGTEEERSESAAAQPLPERAEVEHER